MKNAGFNELRYILQLLIFVIGAIVLPLMPRADAETSPALKIAIKNALEPSPPQSVIISGLLGNKLDRCINHRILAQDISAVVEPYREKTETGSADWRCEYWGKWYTSLTLADAYRSTPKSRELVNAAAKELIATAAPDGYLGTRTPGHRLRGGTFGDANTLFWAFSPGTTGRTIRRASKLRAARETS